MKEKIVQPLANFFMFLTAFQATYIGFICGLISFITAIYQQSLFCTLFWILNRFFDGIDGVIARKTNTQSDLGGYVDIICDFTIYAILPIGLVLGDDEKRTNFVIWTIVSLMEGTFFVNAASLFMLSSILEKRSLGSKQKGELTTVTMPPALIEGSETMIFFTLFIIFPGYLTFLYGIFTIGVIANIVQRLVWAYQVLKISPSSLPH